jgi:hypothetical protein
MRRSASPIDASWQSAGLGDVPGMAIDSMTAPRGPIEAGIGIAPLPEGSEKMMQTICSGACYRNFETRSAS